MEQYGIEILGKHKTTSSYKLQVHINVHIYKKPKRKLFLHRLYPHYDTTILKLS